MPALPTDITRATRRARIVTREDADVLVRFPSAPDQASAAEPGFFESAADAATVLAIKANLTGTFRRRFAVVCDVPVWIDPADGIPSFVLTDAELDFSATAMVARWQLSLGDERTEMEFVG